MQADTSDEIPERILNMQADTADEVYLKMKELLNACYMGTSQDDGCLKETDDSELL